MDRNIDNKQSDAEKLLRMRKSLLFWATGILIGGNLDGFFDSSDVIGVPNSDELLP